MAGRVRLVRDPGRLPALAEVGELPVDVDLVLLRAEKGVVEAEAALDHGRRSLGSERGEPGSDQRPVRGPGRVHRLRRGADVQVREEPTREGAGDPERAGSGRDIQAEEP